MFLSAGHVEQVQLAEPILIAQKCDPFAVPRLLELIHIPGKIGGYDLQFLGGEIDVRESLKLRVFVGSDVNTFAVLAEVCGLIRHLLGGLSWGQLGLLTGGSVHQPEVRFVDGYFLRQQDFFIVRRPVQWLPSSSAQLRQQVVGFRVGRIHHP